MLSFGVAAATVGGATSSSPYHTIAIVAPAASG